MNEKLRQGINQFVRLAARSGLLTDEHLHEYIVTLKKDGDNYSLRAYHQDNDKGDYDKSWNFPTDFSTLNFNFEPTDEDIESAMIDLAGWLSVRITAWERARGGGKATNAKLSAEQRSAAARHAGKNRWKKR